MDHRIVIGLAVGLVLAAVGGFYFALSPRTLEPPVAVAPTAPAPNSAVPHSTAPGSATRGQPSPPASGAAAPAAPAAPPAPVAATPESIEAEIGRSEHAELQGLLKKHFPDEYKDLIAAVVRRRNEGASDAEVGQEAFGRFQEIMRSKLNFAVAANIEAIDKLAANEIRLFHALGTVGSDHCLSVLGKGGGEASQPSEEIRRLMRLATLHRFEAIVDGIARFAPLVPLTQEELAAFEDSLAKDGLKLDEVRSGAFLSKDGDEAGKPCLMVEKLYRAVARLEEPARRKLYSSMFFLGRDR